LGDVAAHHEITLQRLTEYCDEIFEIIFLLLRRATNAIDIENKERKATEEEKHHAH